MTISPSLINALIVAAFAAMLGAGLKSISAVHSRLQAIEITLSKLDTQVSPMWARVQAQISSDLHHPHERYIEMDGLLEVLDTATITSEERARLKIMLQERSVDMHSDITDAERAKAKAMPEIMDMVLIERASRKRMIQETIMVEEPARMRAAH
jgi:hypothetical protein